MRKTIATAATAASLFVGSMAGAALLVPSAAVAQEAVTEAATEEAVTPEASTSEDATTARPECDETDAAADSSS